ncbi:putative transcription factor interactor and regulator CCHC(Zn) family [Helianthus anomalus]
MSSGNPVNDLAVTNAQQELDSKIRTSSRIPRLLDANDFPEWKWRFEQHVKFKEPKLWRCIERGPREIMYEKETNPGVKVKKPRAEYTDEDYAIEEEDNRATSYLTMGLGSDIAVGFRTCKSAKEMWEALIDVYEGNEDMRESRRNLLRQNFNNFNYIYGETIENRIQRFSKIVTQMDLEEILPSKAAQNRQLLNALPKSWDNHVAMIKRTKDLARCTLTEMISHIKACELDDKQRENNHKSSMLAAGISVSSTNSSNDNAALISQNGSKKTSSGSTTVHYSSSSPSSTASKIATTPSAKAELIAFFTQQSKENLEIAASVVNCLNAFVAGKIQPPSWSLNDLYQYHPDDVEEMDITWQMAMAAFRAQKFANKTGRNRWGSSYSNSATVPLKLRCYNCHEPGHLARNCTKPNINKDQAPAHPAPPNPKRALVTTNDSSTVAGEGTQSSALVVQQSADFNWDDEIQRLNISPPEIKSVTENIAFMTSDNKDSSPDVKPPAENLAFMTKILEKVEAYRVHNAELIQDYQDIKNKNFTLAKNEKLYKEKIEAQRKDIVQLKEDLSAKNCNFLDALATISDLTKELEDLKVKYQVNEINIKKFDTSSNLVKNICDIQLEYKEKKGAGLGYTKAPPPYNHNYTYLPFTEEELINEGKMTYGPKMDKSSVKNGSAGNKRSAPSMNFVSKGNVDPNQSVACAEKVDLKCEDTLGGEQALNYDLQKPCFDENNPDLVLGQNIFSMFLSLASNRPDVLGKTDDGCVESVNINSGDEFSSVNNCECDGSNMSDDDSVAGEVPQDTFSETTETTSQENQEYPDPSSESVSVGVPNVESSGTPLETVDTHVEETCVSEISTSSEIETESKSIDKESNVEINIKSSTNVLPNKTELKSSAFQTKDDHGKKVESQSQPTSHACAHSNQLNPGCSKRKPAKFAKPVKKIRNDVKKTPSPHTLKRQTCFNCGIAGHIARNCVHLPRMSSEHKSFNNQKAKSNRTCCSKPVKVTKIEAMKNNSRKTKPSDFDWNATKQRNQQYHRNFQRHQHNVFNNYNFKWSNQHWKPKNKAAQSNMCANPLVNKDKSRFLNRDNLVWKKVTYIDAQGKPRSTMGWVPKSN